MCAIKSRLFTTRHKTQAMLTVCLPPLEVIYNFLLAWIKDSSVGRNQDILLKTSSTHLPSKLGPCMAGSKQMVGKNRGQSMTYEEVKMETKVVVILLSHLKNLNHRTTEL